MRIGNKCISISIVGLAFLFIAAGTSFSQPTIPSPDADQWSEPSIETYKQWMTVVPEPCAGNYSRDCGLTWDFAPGAGYNVNADFADLTTGVASVALANPGWGDPLDVYFGAWSGAGTSWAVDSTWSVNVDVSISSGATPALALRVVDVSREILDYDISALVPLNGSWTTVSVLLSDMTQTTGGTFNYAEVECAGIYFIYTPGDPVKVDNLYLDNGAGTSIPAVADSWTDSTQGATFKVMPEPSVTGRDYDFAASSPNNWTLGVAADTGSKTTGTQSFLHANPGWDRGGLSDPTVFYGVHSGGVSSPWVMTEDWTVSFDVLMNVGYDGIRDIVLVDANGDRLRYDLTSIVPLNPPGWSKLSGTIPEPGLSSAGRDWSFPGWGFGKNCGPDTVNFTAGLQSIQLLNPGWGEAVDILLGVGTDPSTPWVMTQDWTFNIDISLSTINDATTYPNRLVVVDSNLERKEIDLNGILPLDGTWTTLSYVLSDIPTITGGTFDPAKIITAGLWFYGGTPTAKIDNAYFDDGAGTTLPASADLWTESAAFTSVSEVRLGDMPYDTGSTTFDFSQVTNAGLHFDVETGHNVWLDNFYFDGIATDVDSWDLY